MMDSSAHRLATLALAATAVACARPQTNDMSIADTSYARSVSDTSMVAARMDTLMRNDSVLVSDTLRRTDTTRVSSSGEVASPSMNETVSGSQLARLVHTVDRGQVEAARFALTRTQNSEVSGYAQMMITDHSASIGQLESLRQQHGWPAADTTMSAGHHGNSSMTAQRTDIEGVIAGIHQRHEETMNRLRTVEAGHPFDHAYIDAEVQGHEGLLAALRRFATTSGGEMLGTQLTSYIGTVDRHLDRARTIQTALSQD